MCNRKLLQADVLNNFKKQKPKISCYSLRHSKAMHLLQARHESVQTTEVHARVDSKQRREAIEKAYAGLIRKQAPAWANDDNLLEWLNAFR